MNEDFFADLFDGIVSKLHTQNCFVASLIVDNEASQNAGIRSSAKASKLVHFRCGAQTLELLVDALSNHYVGLEESINTAKSVATVINNCKVLLKNFREVQAISNPKKPCLSLLVIGNTRKWNTGYLLLERLLKVNNRCSIFLCFQLPTSLNKV